MDWYLLVREVQAQAFDSAGNIDETKDGNVDVLERTDDKLVDLERDGLLSVMNLTLLQLYILLARMPKDVTQGESTSAKTLHEITRRAMSELQQVGTFEYLYSTVKRMSIKRRADSNLKKSMKANDDKIKYLQRQIRLNDKSKAKDISKKLETIAMLKDEVQNLIAMTESKMRYTDRWENAQQGENNLRCENMELNLKWDLDQVKDRYENEISVNKEICEFLSQQIKKLEDDLKDWKLKYEVEMKLRKDNITRLNEKAREQQFRLRELRTLFKDRQTEIEDYLKFKEQIRTERERNRFIYESATKIQAWWRGTMVRRGLGPYKKRKKLLRDKRNKN